MVCAGNICRSPMAEVLLQHAFPQHYFSSAGIVGLTNYPADEKAQHCIAQLGLDLSQHRARKLDASLIKANDLILVMSAQQQRHIEHDWPFAKGKVFRLGHWQQIDIPDPYQKQQAAFDHACTLIQSCIQDWQDYL